MPVCFASANTEKTINSKNYLFAKAIDIIQTLFLNITFLNIIQTVCIMSMAKALNRNCLFALNNFPMSNQLSVGADNSCWFPD